MSGCGQFEDSCRAEMKHRNHYGVQTTISIERIDQSSFDNFNSEGNQQTFVLLREMLSRESRGIPCYLWGANATGKSHLLFAACNAVSPSIYIPTKDLQLQPEILNDLERYRLICIDDIQSVAGQTNWEDRILALLKNAQSNRKLLILTGNCPPGELDLQLKDLANRLSGCQILKLSPTSDQTKVNILVERAAERGIPINQSGIEFALRRYSRDLHALFRLLDRISLLSLEQHRRITIPFLRELDEFKS